MSDAIASARRMARSLRGRDLDAMTDEALLALCRRGAGCVLCCGSGMCPTGRLFVPIEELDENARARAVGLGAEPGSLVHVERRPRGRR